MDERGFSLVEALIAASLMMTVTAATFTLIQSANGHFAVQPESADLQQRMRVAAGTLYRDLLRAGTGVARGPNRGSLAYFFAPVLPYRQGTSQDHSPGSFTTDTVTLMSVASAVAQTTLAAPGPGGVSGDISLSLDAGCPIGDPICGFTEGMPVVVYDGHGDYDTFNVIDALGNPLHVQRTGRNLTYALYPANTTTVAHLANVVYSLKSNPATGTYQLVQDDGSGRDVPVVEHLVALAFEYYGDPIPPMLTGKALTDPVGPWTTYGPAPPPIDRQIPTQGYPAGENCLFVMDALTGLPGPRLENFAPAAPPGALVPLSAARLTDGPWCPDSASANRWDADLLRIRKIGVTLRVQAANRALRGPASSLFLHGGTSTGGYRWLPDRQIRFEVSPRNLELER